MNLPNTSNLGCNGIFNGVYPTNWHLMRMGLNQHLFQILHYMGTWGYNGDT